MFDGDRKVFGNLDGHGVVVAAVVVVVVDVVVLVAGIVQS